MLTDQQHPITPPPELVREWNEAAIGTHFPPYGYSEYIAAQAARWGADQELEACISAVLNHPGFEQPELFVELLRATRRPKPPSLAEQALEACERSAFGIPGDRDIIRRALERLQELEEGNE